MNDLISRQAAIRWIKTECNPYGKPTLDYETSCRIMEHLDKMPSAQPKRSTDMDRTALYNGILDSYAQEIDSTEVGNYTRLKYKLMHIDSMLQLVNDIIFSDRDLDPRYWAGLEQRSRKLRDIITGKLEDLEN